MSLHPRNILVVLITLLCLHSLTVRAETWHVSDASGNDANPGRSQDKAFKTIQKACDVVQPGDTVIVYPGVYFEHVQLRRAGTTEKPIVFMADEVELGRVIVSGAVREVREKKIKWTRENSAEPVYSVPLDYQPARVLCDDADLAPYASLSTLRSFELSPRMPGVLKGYFYDPNAQKLYVQLHPPDERYNYGSQDPNEHVMKIGSKTGRGVKDIEMEGPQYYNWGILTGGSAHVTLDGFTFETPGFTGVYVQGHDVIVRNSWFRGCRAGVTGQRPGYEAWKSGDPTSDRVVIEYCDYNQGGVYVDVEEAIHKFAQDPRYKSTRFFWWHRKSTANDTLPEDIAHLEYETSGLAHGVGADWIIRHNNIDDCWDGLSAQSMTWAENTDVYRNRFSRNIDNAIEFENHARGVRFRENEVVDCFMPVSWQPLGGMPWPGPCYVYRNLFYMTPAGDELLSKMAWDWSFIKVGANDKNWVWYGDRKDGPNGETLKEMGKDVVQVPGGFHTYNNTVVMPLANFMEGASGSPRKYVGFRFFNNILVVEPRTGKKRPFEKQIGFEFANNLFACNSPLTAELGSYFAGETGICLDDPSKVRFADYRNFDFSLTSDSPAVGRAVPAPGEKDVLKDLGAIPAGSKWITPVVGPQRRKLP